MMSTRKIESQVALFETMENEEVYVQNELG